jgi:hypothetical protein
MSACSICTHPKLDRINRALQERKPGVVAAQFKLDRAETFSHRAYLMTGKHSTYNASEVARASEPSPTHGLDAEAASTQCLQGDEPLMTEHPMVMFNRLVVPPFRACVADAKGDRLTLERMRFTLNEILQDEEMGF